MQSLILAATSNWLLKPFAILLGWIFNGLFYLISQLTTNQCLAITIILFTFLVRAAMLPLNIKQQRSSRKMARLQPQIDKIQAKYENKKNDPEAAQRMNMEIQQLYSENKTSPMSGCLPLLIQMPILFALYEVLRNVPFYVSQMGDIYQSMAATVMSVEGYVDVINSDAFASVVSAIRKFDATTTTGVIDFLYHLTRTQWASFTEALGLTGNTAFLESYRLQESYNSFRLGNLLFNLNENPGWANWGWVFSIVSGGTTFLQSFIAQKSNDRRTKMMNPDAKETQQQHSMKIMMYIFPIMTVWFTATMPLGLGIYWIASNIFGMLSQWISDSIIDREDYKEALKHREELQKRQEEMKKTKSKVDKVTGGRMGTAHTQTKSALAGNKYVKPAPKKETTDEAFARLTKEAQEREAKEEQTAKSGSLETSKTSETSQTDKESS